MKKEKRFVFGLLCVMTALILCACSKSKSASAQAREKATFQVDKKGNLIVTYTEDFKESNYKKDELETQINNEIQEFNDNYAVDKNKGMSQESLTVKKKKVTLKLKFQNYQDYVSYCEHYNITANPAKLFIGKYKDAAAAGYAYTGEYTNAKDSKKVAADKLKDTDSYQMIYTNEAQKISIDGTILYYSDKVSVKDDVVNTTAQADNFIIYKLDK